MRSHAWRRAALSITLLLAGCAESRDAARDTAAAQKTARVLRVCADPNNLPFSNQREEGLENRLARLVADDLGASVEYAWWPQRRAFLRNTLRAGKCDVIMGVPAHYDPVRTTQPYYRSTYVFVYRRDAGLRVTSFDDEALRRLDVGVQLVGDDGANTPPAHVLAARGIVHNVRGYLLYGDYTQESPPARILDALVAGEIDVAIVWGPLAGYFAPRLGVPLEIVPVNQPEDMPLLPLAYDIAIGVRREDEALARELDDVLRRRSAEVRRLLREFGVPIVERPAGRPPTARADDDDDR